MTTQKQRDRDHAIDLLLNNWGIKAGDTIHTVTLHTSRSGMSREIKAVRVDADGPHDISHLVAKVIDTRYGNRGGVVMGGAGMDMGFALVYALSRALFPNGHECTGDRTCHSNDHSNDYNESTRMAKARLLGDAWATDLTDEQWEQVRDLADTIRNEELGYRKGRHHSDGGYALGQVWL